jgi:hypothetical protein
VLLVAAVLQAPTMLVLGRWSATIVFKEMLREGISSLPHEAWLCCSKGPWQILMLMPVHQNQ